MGKDVSWSERCVLVHNETIEVLDSSKVNDDTLREVQFYNIAKGNTDKGLVLCEKENISLDRPQDFLAEMLKSDKVMTKVRSGLVHHQVRIQNYEEKKLNKVTKKVIKQKKHKKNLEASKEKQKNVAAIDKWKKALKTSGENAPDLNKFVSKENQAQYKKVSFYLIKTSRRIQRISKWA